MASVTLEGITKRFDADGPEALSTVDLDIGDGEFVVLVGPSGCGKTTLLRIVAGLESATEGRVLLDGADISGVGPGDRNIAMVFQNYALFPHLTVAENIGFGLRIRGVSKAERHPKVAAAAELLGLGGFLGRRPGELSGGQRQRVAMGRAIVRNPAVFLMDEPLSNLDAKLRVEMRAEISRLQRNLAATTIYVTHDQTEAMTMGDRVVVLDRGVVQQVASPAELYERPVNVFVARFIGAPTMNVLRATARNGVLHVGERQMHDGGPAARPADGAVLLGARPEHIRIVAAGSPEALIDGKVALVEHLGKEAQVHLDVDAALTADDGSAFVAIVDPNGAPSVGATVGVAFDSAAVHVFDPESGAAVGPGIQSAVPDAG